MHISTEQKGDEDDEMLERTAPRRTSIITLAAVGMAALMLLLTVRPASAQIVISGVSPATGPTSGGTMVTITGSGFPANVDLEVTFGGVDAITASVNIAGTVITAQTPPHAAGAVDVVVTDASDPTDTETDVDGFTYIDAPQVIGISPDSGSEEGGTIVSVFGNHFVDGAEVMFGDVEATAVSFVDEHQIDATTPAGTGTVNVTVTNPDDQEYSLGNAFTYTEEEDTSGEIVNGSIPASGGFGLIVFGGGTNAELLEASGCPEATATFYATNGAGGFVTYIPGSGVAAVNAAWNALFPSEIPALTPLVGKCV